MKRIILMVIICFVVLTACVENTEDNLSNRGSEEIKSNVENINESGKNEYSKISDSCITEEDIADFLNQLSNVLTEKDYIKLRDYINSDKVYSISIFDDGRENSQVTITLKEDITQDLILRSSYNNTGGLYLPLIFNYAPLEKLQIINDDKLKQRSITVNWDSDDEASVYNEIPNLKEELRELILMNNKYEPQVFCLKDGLYAFSYSYLYVYNVEDFERLGLEDSYDESEPLKTFTGNWILFSNEGDEFKILAFIEIQ